MRDRIAFASEFLIVELQDIKIGTLTIFFFFSEENSMIIAIGREYKLKVIEDITIV